MCRGWALSGIPNGIWDGWAWLLVTFQPQDFGRHLAALLHTGKWPLVLGEQERLVHVNLLEAEGDTLGFGMD